MKRWLSVVALLAGMLVVILPARAHADVNDFTVSNFTADYTLSQADPQGALSVHEELTVNFTDQNHGILRAIPKSYNGKPLHLHIATVRRDGQVEPYSTYGSNGNEVLKIGSADRTITGLHHYDINYSAINVVRFVGTGAELDWNVNGTQWQQPFLNVQATLHVPASFTANAAKTTCYTGATGSTASDCLVTPTGKTITITTVRQLSAGQTLTFNTPLPNGAFAKPGLRDYVADYGRTVAIATALPLAALVLAGNWWYKKGRDPRGRGTIVPEYAPPAGLKPAEIDVVLHGKLGKNAVSATIIDLAIRKYLRIQETESNGVLGIGKHKVYTFVRLPAGVSDQLSDYETTILNGLFASGDTVEMSSLRTTFYKTLAQVKKSVPRSLATRGYYAANPALAGVSGQVVAMVLFFGSFYLFGVSIALAISGIVAAGIIVVFASLMARRTQLGADTKDAADGLKMYLETAEKDRIAMLQSPSAPYAPQSAEPVKTVELFEKLLPYAMVLGVEQQWAKQFESIYTTPPDWYGGNWSTFNAVYLANSLSSSMNAMNTSFAAPSSSGSGGSAGGGGGGGGGGGW